MDYGVSAPDYWLRRRAGDGEADAIRVNADEAAMIAQRPGAVGDLSGRGLVWQEPDSSSYLGTTFVTLTPVWESGAAGPR
ncbi:hypothetical protein [Catenulispora acidiphila]|uniref:hypothetical protein n=1 Tax=Catenulispora acidiphila TaxID=304895 RepID=UPI0011815FB5|nr:hypothetical protein [Catenulispora acidiphila]